MPALAVVISLAVALAIFGFRIADPRDVSWITGDVVTAQFGWEQYRTDAKHWFPFVADRASFPLTMPIAMFDILPTFAFLVKLFTWSSQAQVQYFGPAFLIGVVLQALFAWLLLAEATRGKAGAAHRISLLIGTLFFATAPILLVRFYFTHMSLSLQWPLIASLWLYVRGPRAGFSRSIRDYSLLGLVAAAINPYIMAMTLLIYGAYVLRHMQAARFALKNIVIYLIPALFSVFSLLISGFIDPFIGPVFPGEGYGIYSANLFSPFDPMSYYLGSSFLPDQKLATGGQYEGFGYFGLGAILLIAAGVLLAVKNIRRSDGLLSPLVVVILIAWLMALSARITFGAYSIEISLPAQIISVLEVFRSSGRFIWVVNYGLLLIAVSAVILWLKPRHALAVLGLAALVQIADLAAPLAAMHGRFARLNGSAQFTDTAFRGLGKAHDTLIVLPAWQCRLWTPPQNDYPNLHFIQISNLVMEGHLRTNSFYAGRTAVAQAKYHCVTALDALPRQPADRRSAYLLSPRKFNEYGAHIAATHFCDFAEDMFLCRADRGKAGMSQRAKVAASLVADPGMR